MAHSTILIEFIDVPDVDQVLYIAEESLSINLSETFKTIRSTSNQAAIPHFYPDDGINPDRFSGFICENYKDAVNLDANLLGQFTIGWTNGPTNSGIGSVLITANFSDAVFSVDLNSTSAIITIVNEGSVPVDPPPTYDVTPLSLNFNVVKSVPGTVSQPLTITTPSAWTITATLPSWLQLSAVSGSGNSVVNVTPINYSAMVAGDHSFSFNVVTGGETFSITIILTVYDFIQNPFLPGKLYFTQELDYLKFSSITPGTYIDFTIEIKVFKINTYEPIIYNRTYKFPLFQGKGDFHIGTLVHNLFEEIQELSDFIPDLKTNYYKRQYRPAEITVSFEEKTFGTTVPGLISIDMPMFKMVKGFKPFTTEGELTLLTVAQQEITRITPKSIIGTSFIYVGTPRIVVKKNNVIIEDFTISPVANQVIYSYFRFINKLKSGDSIDIIIVNGLETRTSRFLVFQNGLENTYFFFENNNQMLEPFEFSGRRRVSSPLKHTTTPKFKNLYAYDKKVDTDVKQTFIVNTGQLGKADHRIITALSASLNVWCSFDNPDGPYFKVDATTTKIDNQDTSTSEEDQNVEFNILENANASIYPR